MADTSVQNVLPDFAELLGVLAHSTKDDVDEILKFIKILQRGREVDVQQPNSEIKGAISGPRPLTTMAGASSNIGGVVPQQGGVLGEPRSPPQHRSVNNTASLSKGMNPFVAPPVVAENAAMIQSAEQNIKQAYPHPEVYYYKGHQLDPRFVAQVEAALRAAPPGNRDAAKNALSYCKGCPEMNNALYAVFGKYCRNCYLGGVGFANTPSHTMMECRHAGNPCMISCKMCPGELHWNEVCPKRGLPPSSATVAKQVFN